MLIISDYAICQVIFLPQQLCGRLLGKATETGQDTFFFFFLAETTSREYAGTPGLLLGVGWPRGEGADS